MAQDWNHEEAMEHKRKRIEKRFFETNPIRIDFPYSPMESDFVKERIIWL